MNDPATKQEWLQSLHAKRQRITLLPYSMWGAILAIILGVALAGATRFAHADPRFQAQNEGITITLYDDACELTDQVANLPLKATWEEKGKTFQGCYGPRPDAGVVVAYFDDKTVALIPFQVLKRLVGA